MRTAKSLHAEAELTARYAHHMAEYQTLAVGRVPEAGLFRWPFGGGKGSSSRTTTTTTTSNQQPAPASVPPAAKASRL